MFFLVYLRRSDFMAVKGKIIILIMMLILSIGCGKKEEAKKDTPKIEMFILGQENLVLNIDELYIEEGIILLINNVDSLDYETIGTVDTSIPGTYKITYKHKDKEIYRTVVIIDNIPPVITLKGSKNISLAEGSTYKEYGYTASDNVDNDITDKVIVSGEVKKTVGTYTLTYTVKDKAENETSVQRVVKVNKKLVEKQETGETKPKQEEKPKEYKNEVIDMIITNNGFKVTGTYDEKINSLYLLNTATEEKTSYSTSYTANNYVSAVDLTSLADGTYYLYLDNDELIVNNLSNLLRIKKYKLGSKLVTFSYPGNNVQVNIANHAYKYDILIDVGHGTDTGAVNATHIERDVNLTLSLYEKRRYEEHGLSVLITRTNNTTILGEGDAEWNELSRRAYAMGYHGTISKIVYSNHHNGSDNKNRWGPEIIVPAALPSSALSVERQIMNAWQTITGVDEISTRFWTRSLETHSIHTKVNGEVYDFTNYYAVIRIPYNLFNVKTIIYEPAYMSHADNWNWYWNGENYLRMSEAKIEYYVKSLGVEYIPN